MSIAIYLGYANLSSQNYGSELALIKLATHLQKWYSVSIVSLTNSTYPNLKMITPQEYSNSSFDCVIISRYVNFYIYLPLRAPKAYIWLHDVLLQPFFNGEAIKDNGKWLLENVICDGLVVQTEWHKAIVSNAYPTATIDIIGNGIDVCRFSKPLEKIPYRFIWTSSPTRGLSYLLSIFPMIKQKFTESELYIYRGPEEFTQEQLNLIEAHSDFIHYEGGVDNDEIAKQFLLSDVWLYPTDFNETYCISALEAQAAGCLCICSDKAALSEVVGSRGILLKSHYGSDEYLLEIFDGLEMLFNNREMYSKKARDWGLLQDWSRRAEMWKTLLDIPALPEYDVSVVNLDRRPDRWNRITSHLSELRNVQRFSAVDGRQVNINESVTHLFTSRGYPQKNPYAGHGWRSGVIGCALSHYHLWENAADMKCPLVVFEDDAVKCDNFLERFNKVIEWLTVHNEEWDVCFLGYLDDVSIYNDEVIDRVGEVSIHQFNPVPARKHGGGTHGYIVNAKGARKLLKLAEKYGIPQPIDWFMIEMFGARVGTHTHSDKYSLESSNGKNDECEPFRALKCLPHLVEQLPGDTDIQGDYSRVQ